MKITIAIGRPLLVLCVIGFLGASSDLAISQSSTKPIIATTHNNDLNFGGERISARKGTKTTTALPKTQQPIGDRWGGGINANGSGRSFGGGGGGKSGPANLNTLHVPQGARN